MQHELLLLLSGHPSPLLSTPDASPAAQLHLHPGEQESILRLSQLATLHSRLRQFCSPSNRATGAAQRVDGPAALEQTTALATLRSILHTQLLQPYTSSILKLEREILSREIGGEGAAGLPLSFVVGEMSGWEGRLRGVGRLLDDLDKGVDGSDLSQGSGAAARPAPKGGRRVAFSTEGPSNDPPTPPSNPKKWTSSPLLSLLHHHASTGDPSLRALLLSAISALEKVWLNAFKEFVIWGRGEGSEALVDVKEEGEEGRKYEFPTEQLPLLPTLSTPQTRSSILISLRAICQALEVLHTLPSPASSASVGKLTLGAKGRKEGQLPSGLRKALEDKLEGCQGPGEEGFITRVSGISALLSTHLLTTHLPPSLLLTSLTHLTSFYLLRLGSFSSNLLAELQMLRTRGARGAGRERGGGMEKGLLEAMSRARAGTELEELGADAVDPLEYFHLALASSAPDEQDPFASRLLGTPLTLEYTPPTPALGLLVDEESLKSYARCWGVLMAVKGAQRSAGSCWATLSHSTRLSSSSSLPSSSRSHANLQTLHALQALHRSTWALVRQALWLLDSLVGHFLGAVVEGAWSGLRSRLEEVGRGAGEVEGAEEELMSKQEKDKDPLSSPPLDFTTLQSLHALYLDLLQSGLLLTNDELAGSLLGLLETCEEVCRTVGGWSAEKLAGYPGEEEAEVIEERQAIVQELSQTFHAQLADFFEALSTASTNPRRTTASSTSFTSTNITSTFVSPPSSSRPSTSRTQQQHPLLLQARVDAEMMSREFLPQLLLRLDFGRWFSRTGAEGEEREGAGEVLGGLRG